MVIGPNFPNITACMEVTEDDQESEEENLEIDDLLDSNDEWLFSCFFKIFTYGASHFWNF